MSSIKTKYMIIEGNRYYRTTNFTPRVARAHFPEIIDLRMNKYNQNVKGKRHGMWIDLIIPKKKLKSQIKVFIRFRRYRYGVQHGIEIVRDYDYTNPKPFARTKEIKVFDDYGVLHGKYKFYCMINGTIINGTFTHGLRDGEWHRSNGSEITKQHYWRGEEADDLDPWHVISAARDTKCTPDVTWPWSSPREAPKAT